MGGGWLAQRAKQGGLLATPTEHPEVQGRGPRVCSRCSVSPLCPTVPKFGILAAQSDQGVWSLAARSNTLTPEVPRRAATQKTALFMTLLKNPGTNADNKPACLSPITSTLLISFQEHLKSPGCSNTDEMRPESRAYSCAQRTAALPPLHTPHLCTALYGNKVKKHEFNRCQS